MIYTASMAVTPPSAESSYRRHAERMLSRAAGAPLRGGNAVELLIDGAAHFDAWLQAIRGARRRVLLENSFCSKTPTQSCRRSFVEVEQSAEARCGDQCARTLTVKRGAVRSIGCRGLDGCARDDNAPCIRAARGGASAHRSESVSIGTRSLRI